MKLIIEKLDEGTPEMQEDLQNYLRSHNWDFKVTK